MKTPAGILIVLVSLTFLAGCGESELPITGKIPPITLNNLNGKTVEIKKYDDGLVLLVFWATWCKPCLMEIPVLKELNRDFSPRGLRIVSILCDNPGMEKIVSLKNGYGIDYEILMGSEKFSSRFGIQAFPSSLLIGKGGKLLDKMEGALPADMFKSRIKAHLPGS
ncbi:TlpA family protein disulfide reductase [Fibrobacterota bacterium]